VDLAPEPLDLLLLGLHLSVAGKGPHRIKAELLHPIAQSILMNIKDTGSLNRRNPTFCNQLDSLNLQTGNS
jgi:hypothetical protein